MSYLNSKLNRNFGNMKKISIRKKIYKPKWYQKLRFWKLYQNFEVEIPEGWDEVSAEDFLNLFAASLIKSEGERGLECIRAILPSEIRDEAHLMSAVSLHRVYSLMNFCEPRLEIDGHWVYEEHKLITNPSVKDFAVNDFNFILSLPGSVLDNLTCEGFRDAIAAYSELQEGRHEASWQVIKKICRVDFVQVSDLAKGLRYPIPQLIVRYFGDSLEKIHFQINQLSPTFFGNKPSVVELYDTINLGWDGLFLEIAKDGVFGTYQQVLRSRFHDVMIYSIKKYEDALAQQREIEKMNNANNQ